MRASDKGLVPRTNDAQVTIRIRREGLPFFSDSEYVVTVPEDLSVGSSVFNLDATEPRVGVSYTTFKPLTTLIVPRVGASQSSLRCGP